MITDYLIEKSNGLLKRNFEPTNYTYSNFNLGGVECEVGEFLYGMVRLLKPFHILETGTHLGISASYMGQACKDNAKGEVETIEYLDHFYMQSQDLFRVLELGVRVKGRKMNIDDFKPTQNTYYDMLFLDSEPSRRWQELIKFYPYLVQGGYVFLHDLPRGFCKGNINPDHPELQDWPWGPIPQEIKDWLKNEELVKFHFPNPREMCGFYRTRLDDYKINE